MRLKKLYSLRDKLLLEKAPIGDIESIDELINNKLNEDVGGSAGGDSGGVGLANATTAGMGNVIQSQPSQMPGSLNGAAWVNGGGKSGSGDIAVAYNPGGGNRLFQKIPAPKGNKKLKPKNNTFKKFSQEIELPKKVMSFKDFEKEELNKVTHLKQ
jgi:hypothetical protein